MLQKSWRMVPFLMVGVLALACGEKQGGTAGTADEAVGAAGLAKAGAKSPAVKQNVAIDALFSPDANIFVSVKPAELLNSVAVKSIVEGVMALPFFQFQEQKSIDELVEAELGVAMSSIDRLAVTLNADEKAGLGVFVHSRPVKEAILAKFNEDTRAVTKTHAGVEYFIGQDDPEDAPALAFLQDNLTIMGTEAEVVGAIERFKSGAKSGMPANLAALAAKAPATASFVVAGIPTEQMLENSTVGEDAKDVKAFVLALSAADTLDLWMAITASDDAAADRFRQDGVQQMAQMKEQFDPMFQSMPDLAPIKNVFNSIAIGGTGTDVTIVATIASDVMDAAPMLMGMFMGGMSGPGGAMGPQDDVDFEIEVEDFDFEE